MLNIRICGGPGKFGMELTLCKPRGQMFLASLSLFFAFTVTTIPSYPSLNSFTRRFAHESGSSILFQMNRPTVQMHHFHYMFFFCFSDCDGDGNYCIVPGAQTTIALSSMKSQSLYDETTHDCNPPAIYTL